MRLSAPANSAPISKQSPVSSTLASTDVFRVDIFSAMAESPTQLIDLHRVVADRVHRGAVQPVGPRRDGLNDSHGQRDGSIVARRISSHSVAETEHGIDDDVHFLYRRERHF